MPYFPSQEKFKDDFGIRQLLFFCIEKNLWELLSFVNSATRIVFFLYDQNGKSWASNWGSQSEYRIHSDKPA